MVSLTLAALLFYAFFFPHSRALGLRSPPALVLTRYAASTRSFITSTLTFPTRLAKAVRSIDLSPRAISWPALPVTSPSFLSWRPAWTWSDLAKAPSRALSYIGGLLTSTVRATFRGFQAILLKTSSTLQLTAYMVCNQTRTIVLATLEFAISPFRALYRLVLGVLRAVVSAGADWAGLVARALKYLVSFAWLTRTSQKASLTIGSMPPLGSPDGQAAFESQIRKIVRQEVARVSTDTSGGSGFRGRNLETFADDIIERIAADKDNRPDFALGSAGARVDQSVPSRAYQITQYGYDRTLALLGLRSARVGFPKPPSVVLAPGVAPGQCWAFPGSQGNLTVRLARPAIPDQFTLEHTPETTSFSVESSPRDFEVFGLRSGAEYLLGRYRYVTGPGARHMQRFDVMDSVAPYAYESVKLAIVGNHGGAYTCLYRFRVHGTEAAAA